MPHLVAAAKTLASLCLLEKFDYVFFSFLFFVVVVVHYNFSFFCRKISILRYYRYVPVT